MAVQQDDPNDNITQSESFKPKITITRKTPAAGNTKDAEITLEMPLINCEVNLILTWSTTCLISSVTRETNLKITEQNFIFLF